MAKRRQRPDPAVKPRVLHLATSLDFGGVESHLRLIAEHGGGDFTHEFAALTVGGRVAEEMRGLGREVTVLGCDPWRQPLPCLQAMRQMLRRERFDVVHCHGAEANLWGLWPARWAGVAVRIGEEIGIPDHGARAKFAYRAAYRGAHRVIGVSEAVRRFLVESGEVPDGRAVTITNPVKTAGVRTLRRSEGEPLHLIFLGRLEKLKNPCGALLSLIEPPLADLAVTLTFVGDGRLREDLEAMIAAHGLESRITLEGFRRDPELVLKRCHALIQPSLTEGFSLGLVEAMSCGLPAIATDVGGNSEIIKHGVNGWIVDGPDPSAIAKGIEVVARLSPDELTAFGARARASVEGRFGIDRYMEQVETLYSEVARQNG